MNTKLPCTPLEDGRECGDEGQLCEARAQREAAYWAAQWAVASPEERDPERYAEDMRDAGRGHLLPP